MWHGLTSGHDQVRRTSLGKAVMGRVTMDGVFRRRVIRVGGVVLIPLLTACRKLAMCLFCGGKKGVDHDEIDMGRGCRFCLLADGIGAKK